MSSSNAASALARLRARLAHLYALADETLPIPGTSRPYTITLPASPDDPLDRFAASTQPRVSAQSTRRAEPRELSAVALAAGQARLTVAAGVHMPYWALLWPSGLALAEALLAESEAVQGRRALELGCGLGVTATAALAAGARLTAADCYAEALLFARYNALRNAGRAPRTLLLDWRTEAGRAACLAAGPFDLLLAADVLYEMENLAPLLGLVPRLLVPGGACWLAEPGRRVSLAFVAAAREAGWRDHETIFDRAWPPDGDEARVAVHRFTLPDLSG
ncbi:MAG TPA: methyltransferase domain-containing protein [Ktedonobacterales bacterium]|nr:methyltransferase domain-containing protein [Ktedonobacterales bacterium]